MENLMKDIEIAINDTNMRITKEAKFNIVRNIFLKKSSDELRTINSVFVKDFREANPDLIHKYSEISNIFAETLQKLNIFISCNLNIVISKISDVIIKTYDNYKENNKIITFDDMLFKAYEMLSNNEEKEWILFQLDGNFEHVLIDEAQDTNALQWKIINKIVEEYFSGDGARTTQRSLVIVGDGKQSIYSFQGSDSEIFYNIKNAYKNNLINENLQKSYRSSVPIVLLAESLTGVTHKTFFEKRYGKIYLKELKYKNTNKKISGIFEFTKRSLKEEGSGKKLALKQLAHTVSEKIFDIVSSQMYLESTQNTVKASDIMILSRSRNSTFTSELHILLQEKNISISGNIFSFCTLENQMVMDFISILSSITYKYDNFSICAILKSPIFKYTNKQIENLLYDLKDKNLKDNDLFEEISKDKNIDEFFEYFLSKVGILNIFEIALLFRVKCRNHYSKKDFQYFDSFLTIINDFCAENNKLNIVAFLEYIREYHNNSENMVNNTQDVNAVQFLTIHSAKGLESPIVILLDMDHQNRSHNRILWIENDGKDGFVFSNSTISTDVSKNIKDNIKAQNTKESDNLLYVAITRAKQELYIYGITKGSNKMQWIAKIKDELCKITDGNIEDESLEFTYGKADFSKNTTKEVTKNIITIEDYSSKIDEIRDSHGEKITFNKKNLEAKKPNNTNIYIVKGKVIHKIFEYIKYLKNIQEIENFTEKTLSKLELSATNTLMFKKIIRIRESKFFQIFLTDFTKTETEIFSTSETNIFDKSYKYGITDILYVNYKEKTVSIVDIKTGKKIDIKALQSQLYHYIDILERIFPDFNITSFVLDFENERLIKV